MMVLTILPGENMKKTAFGPFGIPFAVYEKIKKHQEETAKLKSQNPSEVKKEGFFKRVVNSLKSLLE